MKFHVGCTTTAFLATRFVVTAAAFSGPLHLAATRSSDDSTTYTIRRNHQRQRESSSSKLRLISSTESSTAEAVNNMPVQSEAGIYQIESKDQYAALLKAHPDKLVVVKFFATYCRACKAMEPKFIQVKSEFENLPIVWAEFSAIPSNKQFFRQNSILALPTVHFYDGPNGIVENFPCGPSKIPILKQKLDQFVKERIDSNTLRLKEPVLLEKKELASSEPCMEREVSIGNVLITGEHLDYLRNGMPFFRDLSDEEFDELLKKASLQTFEPGDIIIRQGMPPRNFYVIKTGVVEMCVKSRFDDPISTPSNYLGAAVNQLTTFDYFGERALTTEEPYAASIRVLEKTRCFKFNVEDIPESSILSKKRRATREMVEQLSQRYELPEDYAPPFPATAKDESILELLVRFKQIRQAAKYFEYVMKTEPNWGDSGEIARRALLVSKLSKSQRAEFKEVFNIADVNNRGKITLLEMKRFMESAQEKKPDEELLEMINKANPLVNGYTEHGITLEEFLGVMAEAEFYSLFTETFQALDKEKTGYVRAGDLDQVLGGVRDLISDDRKSIIDVEDKDVLVDYEQFSKMLLGAAL